MHTLIFSEKSTGTDRTVYGRLVRGLLSQAHLLCSSASEHAIFIQKIETLLGEGA